MDRHSHHPGHGLDPLLMRLLGLGLVLAIAAQAQDGAERLDPTTLVPAVAKELAAPVAIVPVDTAPMPKAATAVAPKDSATAPAATSLDSTAQNSTPTATVVDSATKTIPTATVPMPGPAPVVQTSIVLPNAPLANVVIRLDTSASRTAKRSVWAAAGLSLLLPGAGEQYLGATTRAKVFFATELVSVAAAWLSWRNRDDALVSARELASRYAGADAQDKSISFLELMGQYRSRRQVGNRHDSYDEAMLLSGQSPERIFPNSDTYTWDWGSTENPDNDSHLRSYESQLRVYRASKVALSFSLGAMGVSRILSLADVLWLHRRAAWVDAAVVPLPQGAAGRLAWRF